MSQENLEMARRSYEAWLCTIRDGLIVRICIFQEVQEALEAAGLQE